MASILTHIALIKEIKNKYPKLFTKKDLNYLMSGSVYPDLFYFTQIKDYNKYPNLSHFLHQDNNGLDFGEKLLINAKTKKEICFAIGFISHFLLDRNIHNYFHKKNIYYSIEHSICECYLDAEFEKSKIIIPYFPKKLLKNIIKEYDKKNTKKYLSQINANKTKLLFFKLANQVINKIVNQKYRVISKKKTKISIQNMLIKIAQMFKYKKMGLNVSYVLNPDIKIKFKHLENMYREYLTTVKEMENIINRNYDKIILSK